MPLPILNSPAQVTPESLVRYFHQTEQRMAEHLGEVTALDVGTAIANPALSNVHDANVLLDAAIPEGMSAAEVFDLAQAHFAAQRTRGWKCVLNPSLPAERTAPVAEPRVAHGHTR